MRATSLLAALATSIALAGMAQDDNLLRNPGFEDATNQGWVFVNHGQDFARGEIQAQNYHGGLKAASVTVAEKPRVYASWFQDVKFDKDSPDELSLWYSAPDNSFEVLIGAESFTAEKSISWRQATFKLQPMPDTRQLRVELRVNQQGKYLFDDLQLVRRDAPFSGKPDRLLFVDGRGGVPQQERLPALMREAFAKRGWDKLSFVAWDKLSPNLLRRAQAVVFVGMPRRPELTDADHATIKLLQRYAEAGGGVLLTQNTAQMAVTELAIPDALARAFGTRILLETVVSDPANTKQIGKWPNDTYTFTDQVMPPVNQGIKGVCYHSDIDWLCLYGVLPFLPETPWQVVLSGGPKSHSVPGKIGLEQIDKEARPEGFAKNVPLAGVRDYGAGRAAYVGLMASNIFARPVFNDEGRETYEVFMSKGWEGHPSDLLTFYANVIAWVSANADKLESADWKSWPNPAANATKRSFAWKLHKGVVGPRTIYSTGTSSPEDYVKKAKAAGLDFIVFLEDFAALKPGGFENLKADCRELSDAKFAAIPGFTYTNTDGNHEYVFSDSVKLPSMELLDRTGKRFRVYTALENAQANYVGLHYLYALLAFENTAGWYDFSKNPYPSHDARNVNSMAVVTQEGGKTIDRELPGYMVNNRNSQSLMPLALTLMTDAKELDKLKDGSYYTNVVGAEGIEQIVQTFTTIGGRAISHLYPGAPPFGATSITQGPVVELTMPRADVDAEGDIYNKKLQEWDLSLKVSSDTGLKEVLVMDGDTPIRRFLPDGAKNFTFNTSLGKERQKHLWIHARDIQGGEAIGRAINCNSWILRETQCADRNNQLLDSRQLRPDGSPFFVGYGGETTIPDKGPWNGRVRPVGCFVFDKKLGVGGVQFDGSPENHPTCRLNPCLIYDGQPMKSIGWVNQLVAGKEGGPHVMPRRVVASSEALVGERVLDGVFPLDANPVIHVWQAVYPVSPSKFLKTTARTTFHLVKPDGVSAYLWEQDFELLQDIPTKDNQSYFIKLGTIDSSGAKERLLVSGKTVAFQGPMQALPVKDYPFNDGDYVAFMKNPFGSLAVYSLTDGLAIQTDGMNCGVGIKPTAAVMKAGTKLRARLLLVGMNKLVEDPAALAARVAKDYGLAGAPAYTVEARQGEVLGTKYRLDLAASPERCFVGAIAGLDKLPGNLGCRVSGLNDHWTAFFQEQDGKQLKTRILPVEQGTAYLTLRGADNAKEFFAGHPVVADNQDIVLNVARSQDWKRWLLEVHNPTDQSVTTWVRSSPHALGLKFAEQLELKPGSSQFRDLGPTND